MKNDKEKLKKKINIFSFFIFHFRSEVSEK